ncbi:MAG: alpha/beta hydrolase domain-containing protein [Vicinamibacterales bacterium]
MTPGRCLRRRSCFALVSLCLLTTTVVGEQPAQAASKVPGVRGPLPVTPASYPFGAADHTRVPEDLAASGYVEEEFLVGGTANVYDWPAPGPAAIRTAGVPYVTRVLVRRPAGRDRFSGTVIVEMLNPSNLFDLNLGWAISGRQIVRSGDAWVGVTAKPVSIATLRAFDATRYAALSMANPLPISDPGNCTTVAADSARTTENGLAWDIYTQVGAWLRSRSSSNPLTYRVDASAPHPVQRLYGWGYSQTGSFLYTYINAVHPLVVKDDGRSMFDAYLIAVASGPTPIHQCAAAIPPGDERRFIRNAGVPVVRVMSQSDYLSGIAARRPDSDTAPDLYRNYEVAGSGHATPDELNFAAAPADIEKGGREVPPMSCTEGPRSRFPNWPAFNAVLRNLDVWVRTGTPPPHAEPILVADGKPVLDRFGNVIGGIRSPFVEAPTSTWFGNSTGPSFCRIAGHEVPFTSAQLKTLYPTPQDYVRAVTASASRLVVEGFIVQEDAAALMAEAERRAAELLK